MGSIYLLQEGDKLVEMSEQAYDSESLLQELIAKYPSLLAGDQINSESPRRWLLVSRELSLASEEDGAGRLYIDECIDPEAVLRCA